MRRVWDWRDYRDRLGGRVPRAVAAAAVRGLAGLSDFLPRVVPHPDRLLRRVPVVRDLQGAADPAPRSACRADGRATPDPGPGPAARGGRPPPAPPGNLAGGRPPSRPRPSRKPPPS